LQSYCKLRQFSQKRLYWSHDPGAAGQIPDGRQTVKSVSRCHRAASAELAEVESAQELTNVSWRE